jgi:signal transduction histidine kinase
MRERAEQLGGALTLQSAPGDGTRLKVEMPL